jgi:hypothetical protein
MTRQRLTHRKMELGLVYYLTTTMIFPGDNEFWLRQCKIPGASTMAIYFFVNRLRIPPEQKSKLCSTLEASWKDDKGVWMQLKIERTMRRDRNGRYVQEFRG